MRSTWKQAILVAVTAAAVPGQLMAHPGHEGHGMPLPAPLSGQDYLNAAFIVAGLWCVRLIVRRMWRTK